MGVEYEIRCRTHKEKISLGKLLESFAAVTMIVENKLFEKELKVIEAHSWLKTIIDERYLGQISDAFKFRARHSECELFLWNDHADLGDDEEGTYYPEMDEDKPLDRTEDFLRNVKEKTPQYVETREGKPYFITNKHSLPYEYGDRSDLIVKIPCRGPVMQIVSKYDVGWDAEQNKPIEADFVQQVFVTNDGRQFLSYSQGLFGEFTTLEEIKKTIKQSRDAGIDIRIIRRRTKKK